jgi:ABC-2 type transport system ATP-binding protein
VTAAAVASSATGPTGPAVEIDRLVKRYGGRAVVDGVSLRAARGELVALLGPNGAGKTTTVEIVEGYRRADGGSVRVLGLDSAAGGAALRARVGLMLQGGGGVDPRLTPAEALRLFARFHLPARDPAELLEVVGLGAVAGTRFRRLSGGERQRLALALALVGRPEVLVLDEPTAGMDPATRASTRALVRCLCDEGAAVLLTTHDLGDVERIADRVAILDRGRIVADDAPAVVAAAATPALRVRFAAPVALDALAEAVGAGRARLRVDAQAGDPLAATICGAPPDPGLVAAVATWAAERGVLVAELRTTAGSLEERYLELTGDRDVERSA